MSRVWVIRSLALAVAILVVAGVAGAVTNEPTADRVVEASAPRRDSVGQDTEAEATTTTTGDLPPTTTTPVRQSSPTTARPRTSATAPSATDMTTHAPTSLKSGIYVVSAEGGATRRIVAGTGIHNLSWTPTGDRVTYMVNNQVWTVPAAGGPAAPLTPQSPFMLEATWSNSGKYLAYGSTEDPSKGTQLLILEVATGTTRNLGDLNAGFRSMAWQAHKDVLAYADYKGAVVYDADTQQSYSNFPFPSVQSPFAWSDDGHELAYQYQNDLAVMTFTDPANYWTDRPFRIVAHAFSPKEPVWIGDRIFFVNPWKLDVAAAAGNDQRNLVSDYVGSLRVPIRNQSVLFLSIGADSDVANRHIERIALDGSDRRVVANPIPGHQIQDYAVSPEGDTVAFWAVGE